VIQKARVLHRNARARCQFFARPAAAGENFCRSFNRCDVKRLRTRKVLKTPPKILRLRPVANVQQTEPDWSTSRTRNVDQVQ
jgi:hypothetical protein